MCPMENKLTEGSIAKSIIALSIPIFGAALSYFLFWQGK